MPRLFGAGLASSSPSLNVQSISADVFRLGGDDLSPPLLARFHCLYPLVNVSPNFVNSSPQIQAQRAGAPIFDCIVELGGLELERGQGKTWTIIKNVDLAVDAILDKKPYTVEKRTRIPRNSGLNREVPEFPMFGIYVIKQF